MKPSESWAMTADQSAIRSGWRNNHELALRNAMETLMRDRIPDARICHEMVMGAREARADVVAVAPHHISAIEVKGQGDNVTRLLHQVGLYQLCVPEVWMVLSADKHCAGRLVRHLLPSCGLIVAHNLVPEWRHSGGIPEVRLDVEAEPVPRDPHPVMMLEMMWAQELANICSRANILAVKSKLPARATMMGRIIEALDAPTRLRECCTELRGRHALWRADPVVTP